MSLTYNGHYIVQWNIELTYYSIVYYQYAGPYNAIHILQIWCVLNTNPEVYTS